jgi:hypothetical protein
LTSSLIFEDSAHYGQKAFVFKVQHCVCWKETRE